LKQYSLTLKIYLVSHEHSLLPTFIKCSIRWKSASHFSERFWPTSLGQLPFSNISRSKLHILKRVALCFIAWNNPMGIKLVTDNDAFTESYRDIMDITEKEMETLQWYRFPPLKVKKQKKL
ncbi:hypothetical protein BT96DRAFT_921968, partial [Gymnopus androsaceus JB14]